MIAFIFCRPLNNDRPLIKEDLMRTPDVSKALQSFSAMMTEKKQLVEKERTVLDRVNRAIKRSGYQVISLQKEMTGKRRGRPLGSRNKPKQQGTAASAHDTARRGPGRPKLRKVA